MSRLALALIFAAPYIALAAPKTFSDLVAMLVDVFNTATTTLIVFGLVAFFYGIATNINHFGEDKEHEKVKAYFFWGIVILFVMVSIWGITKLIQNTLFGDTYNPSGGQAPANCESFGDCVIET